MCSEPKDAISELDHAFAAFALEVQASPGLTLDVWCAERGIPEEAAEGMCALESKLVMFAQSLFEEDPLVSGAAGLPWRRELGEGARIGRFRLHGKLGVGGMGEVWRAWDETSERFIALKLLRPGRLDEPALERFRREAQAGEVICHEGIVETLDSGEDDGLFWIALEYIPGSRVLSDAILAQGQQGSLEPAWFECVAVWVADLSDAVRAVHANGFLHRDLKPENVLLTPTGKIKLLDLGLVYSDEHSTMTDSGTRVGTISYMSPEQLRCEDLDERSDLFSLGVVLYELLTLENPFAADSTLEVASNVTEKDPSIPSSRAGVPRDLAVIAMRAIEKRAEDRYASVAAFGEDLRRVLAGRPILARPISHTERLMKWRRRHPLLAALGAVLVAFAGASAWFVRALQMTDRELLSREIELQTPLALQALDQLELEAVALVPAHPDQLSALEAWLLRAETLLETLEPYHLPSGTLHPGHLAVRAAASVESQSDMSDEFIGLAEQLVLRLKALNDPNNGLLARTISEGTGWGIARRIEEAQRLESAFQVGGVYDERWNEARAAIAKSTHYEGMQLPMQMGLVPIGPDPRSGLWEFWHVLSGAEPMRDLGGQLRFNEHSGVVLVLLPAAEFILGAQNEAPDRPNYDPQAHVDSGPLSVASVSTFFLSKYEYSVAQWERIRRRDPSNSSYRLSGNRELKVGRANPVTDVTFAEALAAVVQIGLTLPSELQWEYAARGGTSTPWWTGTDVSSLEGHENFCDLTAHEFRENEFPTFVGWRDGYVLTAPVDSLSPNPFGFHHMAGNVTEYTRSSYGRYPEAIPLDWDINDPSERIITRGGNYDNLPAYGSSAVRHGLIRRKTGSQIGFRASRELDR